MNKLIMSLVLFVALILNSAFADHPQGTIKVDIYGLVCDFCAQALEKVFAKEDAVDNIDVNLDDKIVTIHLKARKQLSDKVIRKNIVDAGYNIEEIRRGG
ncbi:MAG: heavy-metal-associated domain-containing protein [Gammaproteobacteria bacterium]|nr:heavy-metal-associated domain-containing protein [Gammaproteobacteria bacterium]